MATFDGIIQFLVSISESPATNPILENAIDHIIKATKDIDAGTGRGKIDAAYSESKDEHSKTVLNSVDLDSSLTGRTGTVNFAKIKLIIVLNESDTAGLDVDIFGNANGVQILSDKTVTLPVDGGGFFIWYDPDGVAVTGGSTDVFDFDPGGNTVDYSFLIAGEST